MIPAMPAPTIALIASVRIGPAATRFDRTPYGPASRAIAFEGLLNSGESFAARLKAGVCDPKARGGLSLPEDTLVDLRKIASEYGLEKLLPF